MPTDKNLHSQLTLNLRRATHDTDVNHQNISEGRDQALRTIAEKFLQSLAENQFTLSDIEPLLFPQTMKSMEPQKAERSASSAPKYKLKKGTVYQNPASNETWTAGGNGARPEWIQRLMNNSADISSLVLIDSPQS